MAVGMGPVRRRGRAEARAERPPLKVRGRRAGNGEDYFHAVWYFIVDSRPVRRGLCVAVPGESSGRPRAHALRQRALRTVGLNAAASGAGSAARPLVSGVSASRRLGNPLVARSPFVVLWTAPDVCCGPWLRLAGQYADDYLVAEDRRRVPPVSASARGLRNRHFAGTSPWAESHGRSRVLGCRTAAAGLARRPGRAGGEGWRRDSGRRRERTGIRVSCHGWVLL
jgi:hypothetical protein